MVASLIQHIRTGKPRRAGSHHSYFFLCPEFGNPGFHITVCKSLFDNGQLVFFNRNGLITYPTEAGYLAQGRAHTPGKFREIVGLQ